MLLESEGFEVPHGLASPRDHSSNDPHMMNPEVSAFPRQDALSISQPGPVYTQSPRLRNKAPHSYSRALYAYTKTYEPSPLESISPTVGIGTLPLLAYIHLFIISIVKRRDDVDLPE